ncbi:MAG: hypothetical protein ACRDPJ_20285 [Nocardioidaceae bacterium]
MARVIIEGLHDRASLLSPLQVVLEVLNRDRAFDLEEHIFVPSEPDQPEGESDDCSDLALLGLRGSVDDA